jgi:hypothetical protein
VDILTRRLERQVQPARRLELDHARTIGRRTDSRYYLEVLARSGPAATTIRSWCLP